MAIYIKNVILYDAVGAVVGFVEIRPAELQTHLRVKQSLSETRLMLSLVIDGTNKIFKLNGSVSEFILDGVINLDYEVFVCLVKRMGHDMVALASGAINLNKLKSRQAIQEIDHAIKHICSVDANGQGECETCPYRDYFFKQA